MRTFHAQIFSAWLTTLMCLWWWWLRTSIGERIPVANSTMNAHEDDDLWCLLVGLVVMVMESSLQTLFV